MADLIIVNKADGALKTLANHAKVEYMHALQLLRHKTPTWTPTVCKCLCECFGDPDFMRDSGVVASGMCVIFSTLPLCF